MSFSEQVKKQLTKCCKKRQPVLLHGEDHVGRLDLVQEVHKENVDVIDLPDSEIFIKEIGKQLSKAVYDELDKRLVAQSTDMPEGILGDAKVLGELDILRIEIDAWDKARNFRIQEGSFMTESELNAFAAKSMLYQIIIENESKVREYFKSTDKTYLEIDCESDKGMEIYNYLVKKIVLDNIEIPHDPVLELSFFSVPIFGSILFDFRGTLFLNNLHCDSCNDEDKKYYRHLGNIIEKRKMEPEDNLLQEANPINPKAQYNVSVNWLVAYTQNLNDFPESLKKDFIDQFEPISLEDVKTDSMLDAEILESEGRGEVEKEVSKGKRTECLRLGDHPDKLFYATAKGIEGEMPLKLSPNTQEYSLLLHLYNYYGNNSTSEDLLIACNIQNHKKGEAVTDAKVKHLRKVVADARTALESACLKRGHLKYEYELNEKNKVVTDECCLLIHCSPK